MPASGFESALATAAETAAADRTKEIAAHCRALLGRHSMSAAHELANMQLEHRAYAYRRGRQGVNR
jgi:hypothetical protein